MAEVLTARETCENCGVAVRENTLFCYNCGTRVVDSPVEAVAIPVPDDDLVDPEHAIDVAPEIETEVRNAAEAKTIEARVGADPDKAKAAIEELERRFRVDEEEEDQLAKAAAERRKARVTQRKNVRYKWEPLEQPSEMTFLLVAVVVTVVAAVIVLLTVVWK